MCNDKNNNYRILFKHVDGFHVTLFQYSSANKSKKFKVLNSKHFKYILVMFSITLNKFENKKNFFLDLDKK